MQKTKIKFFYLLNVTNCFVISKIKPFVKAWKRLFKQLPYVIFARELFVNI